MAGKLNRQPEWMHCGSDENDGMVNELMMGKLDLDVRGKKKGGVWDKQPVGATFSSG